MHAQVQTMERRLSGGAQPNAARQQTACAALCTPRGSFLPQAAHHPILRFKAPGHLRRAATITLAAVSPEPTAPWYEDTHVEALPDWLFDRETAAAPPLAASIAAAIRANDPNHGHTWLTHPCPSNPFRTRADEDMWYVPPSQDQRRLAMTLGLPLYGIC